MGNNLFEIFWTLPRFQVGPQTLVSAKTSSVWGERVNQQASISTPYHAVRLRNLGMRAVASLITRIHGLTRQACAPTLSRSTSLVLAHPSHVLHHNGRRPLSLPQLRPYHSRLAGEPTIYALSTASGKAAIAVIRISGPACKQV